MIRAALFDLDGTLVDLPVPIEAVRAEIAARFAARGWGGAMRPILASIDAAAAAVATSAAERVALIAAARALIDRAEIEAAGDATWRDGAAPLLTALIDRGVAVGVVTNNCAASARVALADWPIAVVVGRDEVARPKPDPAGLLAALDRLGTSTATWVGDRDTDVAAGLAARAARPSLALEIVAVGLIGSGADREIESLAQLC